MLQAMIFDMDGTILDTLRDLTDALNAALAENGLPGRSLDEVRQFVGNGIRRLVERGVPDGCPADVTEQVFRDFNAYYKDHCADHTQAYDGVTDLLAALRDRGVKTAVVSNKSDYAVQALCAQYFPGLFDLSLGVTDVRRRKPSPDMVEAALTSLGVDRKNAVYVGDSDVDIETAQNSGLPCISVTWGFRNRAFLQSHGAAVFADTPGEILRFLPPKA